MIIQCATCIHGFDALEAVSGKGYDPEIWMRIQNAAQFHQCVDYWPEAQYGVRK